MLRIWICFILSVQLCAQPAKELKSILQEIESSEDIERIYLYLADEDTKQVLLNYHGNEQIAFGSVHKLFILSMAMDILPKDFRFKTELAHTGRIINNKLKGSIYIVGGGDPSLGFPNWEQSIQNWIDQIKKLKVDTVEGDIIGDASLFGYPETPDTWLWEDIGNWYGASPCGLNFHHNWYSLYFQPSMPTQIASLKHTNPSLPYIDYVNNIYTGAKGSGDQAYIYGGMWSKTYYLKGTVPEQKALFSVKGALPEPTYFVAYQLKKSLQEQGIFVKGVAKSMYENSPKKTTFYAQESKDIQEIYAEVGLHSNNLYAEALHYYLRKIKGQDLKRYWQDRGFSLDFHDASGLSPYNLVSLQLLAQFLGYIRSKSYFSGLVSCLSISSNSGTLKNICQKSMCKAKVIAKTGTVKYMKAYAGYIDKKNFVLALRHNNASYATLTAKSEEIFNAIINIYINKQKK